MKVQTPRFKVFRTNINAILVNGGNGPLNFGIHRIPITHDRSGTANVTLEIFEGYMRLG